MSETDFNCDCVDINNNQTLAQLRRRMLIRLGYAAQADNPPPGMADLLDDFLRDAQEDLFRKNPSLRADRLFRWTMVPGTRYYGIQDNDSQTDFTDIDCTRHLNDKTFNISWVGVEDLNEMWFPLLCGINPSLYTTAEQEGLPQLYEIRSCIEIFPAPNAAYKLWVKGQMGLEPFTGDSDQTTVDSDLVFVWALAAAKAHYGQKDAARVEAASREALSDYIAGNHLTRRYVPGRRDPPPAVQPIMTHFIDSSGS
jgi:hypothetical protein